MRLPFLWMIRSECGQIAPDQHVPLKLSLMIRLIIFACFSLASGPFFSTVAQAAGDPRVAVLLIDTDRASAPIALSRALRRALSRLGHRIVPRCLRPQAIVRQDFGHDSGAVAVRLGRRHRHLQRRRTPHRHQGRELSARAQHASGAARRRARVPEKAVARLHTIAAGLADTASFEHPDVIAPVTRPFDDAKDFSVDLEPYTVAVLEIQAE